MYVKAFSMEGYNRDTHVSGVTDLLHRVVHENIVSEVASALWTTKCEKMTVHKVNVNIMFLHHDYKIYFIQLFMQQSMIIKH